jgi:hypothetical protein
VPPDGVGELGGQSAQHSRRALGVQPAAERLQGQQPLYRYDAEEDAWREIIVEDRRAGPAETAAARIDIHDWIGLLPARDRKIAGALAVGNSTGDVAMAFRLSSARISQKRQEYRESWLEYQGEGDGDRCRN